MSKIKLLVEIEEYHIKELQEYCKGEHYGQLRFEIISSAFSSIANGTPYNPSGDAISREALKKYAIPCQIHNGASTDLCVPLYQIDNAPPVPQVTVFTENADEKAVADLKAELQNVVEARPNEQIAWEQGYEAGLAQGKHKQKGEWEKDNIGIYCSVCKMHLDVETSFCPLCGADMRKGGAE